MITDIESIKSEQYIILENNVLCRIREVIIKYKRANLICEDLNALRTFYTYININFNEKIFEDIKELKKYHPEEFI